MTARVGQQSSDAAHGAGVWHPADEFCSCVSPADAVDARVGAIDTRLPHAVPTQHLEYGRLTGSRVNLGRRRVACWSTSVRSTMCGTSPAAMNARRAGGTGDRHRSPQASRSAEAVDLSELHLSITSPPDGPPWQAAGYRAAIGRRGPTAPVQPRRHRIRGGGSRRALGSCAAVDATGPGGQFRRECQVLNLGG